MKNSVSQAIFDTNMQAEDIENILSELRLEGENDYDSENELLEEEY